LTFFKSSTIGCNESCKGAGGAVRPSIRLVEARMQDEVVIHAYYGWFFDTCRCIVSKCRWRMVTERISKWGFKTEILLDRGSLWVWQRDNFRNARRDSLSVEGLHTQFVGYSFIIVTTIAPFVKQADSWER
jgi:hypothetical protein